MLSTPIVLENLDIPFLLETSKFAIHALYTEFVGRCTWLFSIHMREANNRICSVQKCMQIWTLADSIARRVDY